MSRFHWRPSRRFLAATAVTAVAMAGTVPSYASTVSGATFTGDAGTASVGGTLYAKSGGALTLTVNTSTDTRCVEVTGAHSARQTSDKARSSWTFSVTAGAGNGQQTVTAKASPNFNENNCTGQSQSPQSASYTLDNTGPVVTADLTPQPNAAGWNNTNVAIAWSATDAGSGVASGPTPASDSQQQNTSGVTKTATATDRLGNTGNGSVIVKVDKAAPIITGSRSPAPNSAGWNNTDVTVSFTCTDSVSGIKSCPGATTLSTSAANQSVSGTAVDNAGNAGSATMSEINIDKVAPTLRGEPATTANAAGWYNADVTVDWTAGDALSGVVAAPASSTISSEGTGLTTSASVSDRAGNTTNAASPAVKIDKTMPNTTATAPGNWNNSDVTVVLNASDALSGVAATYYRLNGGGQQTGTSVPVSAEGVHTLEFWSVDNAGNEEKPKSVEVKIDKTRPTITHTQSPTANGYGWNNSNVTVTFICGDEGGSGIANCSGPETVTAEGQNQRVTGTAVDNAGNTATDPATVSIDMTAPTISAAADRVANEHGWYRDDVTVSFTCADSMSGIGACPSPVTVAHGANQTASGIAVDAAGNTAGASVSGINVDKTGPTLRGAATTDPNGAGWYTGDVVIAWTCTDDGSGVDVAAPESSTVTGEGGALSASATCTDKAGNAATSTVSGIKIDRTAPVTTATVPAPLASGWYPGDVKVELETAADLSGVATTYYAIDGGEAQRYTSPFNHSLKGERRITYWSVDNAGNVEDSQMITLKIDGVVPTITGSRDPSANVFGWNNTSVTVSFACSDAESGVAVCPNAVTVTADGAGHSVTGEARDNAGNADSTTVSDINIDQTPPTLAGAATSDPNANGWYKGDVTIQWTGQDSLSGIDPATQPPNSVITGEGLNLGAGAVSISDKAGNVGPGSVSGIKIDRGAPSTPSISGIAATAYTSATLPALDAISCTATDDLSTLDSCTISGYSAAEGTHTLIANAIDKAGNESTSQLTYTISNWVLKGFFAPVGESNSFVVAPGAASPTASTSTVWQTAKGGSTIPLKFEIFKSGVESVSTADVKAFQATKLNSCTGTISDGIEELASAGSSSLRYDAVEGQFVQNWKTSTVSSETCYRVALTTQDGSTIHTFVRLRK